MQYDYDHRNDQALFLDKRFIERKLEVMRTTYERNKELARAMAGPAVMETFGGAAVCAAAQTGGARPDREAGGAAASLRQPRFPDDERVHSRG